MDINLTHTLFFYINGDTLLFTRRGLCFEQFGNMSLGKTNLRTVYYQKFQFLHERLSYND